MEQSLSELHSRTAQATSRLETATHHYSSSSAPADSVNPYRPPLFTDSNAPPRTLDLTALHTLEHALQALSEELIPSAHRVFTACAHTLSGVGVGLNKLTDESQQALHTQRQALDFTHSLLARLRHTQWAVTTA